MLPTDAQLREAANELGQALVARGWMLASTESCTGGWLAQAITEIPGASAWFERGFVTYSNASKQEMLGVRAATLEQHGAVSLETAREMSDGVLLHSHAHAAIAITGVAGPTGGTSGKPVGTVCFAWTTADQGTQVERVIFDGDRHAIRAQSVLHALKRMIERVR